MVDGQAGAAVGERVGVAHLGLAEHLVALGRDLLGRALERQRLVVQRPLDVRVPPGLEERPQDLLALPGIGLEELLEPALREHHDLTELLGAEPEDVLGLRRDLAPAARQRRPVRDETARLVAAQPPERGLLQVRRRALAADLGALLLGRALGAVEVVTEREVEAHPGEGVGVGVVAAHGGAAARAVLLEAAAGLAVQRERHGVEDGRLAGAGGSRDRGRTRRRGGRRSRVSGGRRRGRTPGA